MTRHSFTSYATRSVGLILVCLAASPLATARQTSAANPQPASSATQTSAIAARAASTVGLADVLQTIAARSPDVLAAQAATIQAQAQVQQARAAWFGQIDLDAQSQHFNDPRLIRPITLPPNVANYPFSRNQFGYGITFQIPVDLSGQIAAEVDAARARAAGARWSAEDVRLRTLLQGAAFWRNLQALAGQRQALDKQSASLQVNVRVAEAGLKVGNIARVNLLRVQAAVAAVQAQIAGVQGQERKVRAQIAALMGQAIFGSHIQPLHTGPTKLPANPGRIPAAVRAAQSTLHSDQAAKRAAQRALFPQFFINGGWDHNAIQWDSRGVDTWQVNVGVRLNLWSGGAQVGAINVAQAAAVQAQQRLQSVRDNLRAAREGAMALWNAQEQAWKAAQSGLRAAAESAHIEQDRFKHGLDEAATRRKLHCGACAVKIAPRPSTEGNPAPMRGSTRWNTTAMPQTRALLSAIGST